MAKQSDGKSGFLIFAKVISYLAYAYFLISTIVLTLAFFLLLLGANPTTGFVKFVYHFAAVFLEPFRGIFPTHQISDRSYFSGAALFAIIMYGIAAMLVHSLITYLSLKQVQHQQKLEEAQAATYQPTVASKPVPTNRPKPTNYRPKV
ncbi:MAG TPA: hypothetical protein VLF79_03435 [Candidatus Saccharimonadales bacterium]|nr:hypothetical protein [Candidatus Saccharimonadales bacterium]